MADQKRHIARKVNVALLLQGKYVKEEGWNPNFIEVKGSKIYRVNLLAVIVSPPGDEVGFKSFVVDDGTGSIAVRSFDDLSSLKTIQIGELVTIIGRPREYNNERYIVPEIIKKVKNPKWAEVRKLEIVKIDIKQEESTTKEDVTETSGADKVYAIIKELDQGKGALCEEVIKRSNFDNTEELIASLIKEGEVFEVLPGVLKILE